MAAEIEVPRRTLTLALAVLAVVGLVVMGWLGWANSPRGGDGRPLLLTPERRAVRRYLDAARDWAARMGEVGETLDRLTPAAEESGPDATPTEKVLTLPEGTLVPTETLTVELPPAAELPTLTAPEARPADLYQRVHTAQAAHAVLEEIARQVERTVVPEALVGLRDARVLPALEAHIAWCEAVLVYAGAPEAVEPARLAELQAQAHAALAALREALQ